MSRVQKHLIDSLPLKATMFQTLTVFPMAAPYAHLLPGDWVQSK